MLNLIRNNTKFSNSFQKNQKNYFQKRYNNNTNNTPERNIPSQAEIIIVGGGIVGCSLAYHLAKAGKEVLLLERKGITHGSTWHAAGLVGQLRSSYNMTKIGQESVALYNLLSKNTTDYTLEYKQVGSLRVASSQDRWLELQKSYGMAKSFGFEMYLVSDVEAKRLCPILDINGVVGAAWIPSDGYIDPPGLTIALAKNAKKHGARIIEGLEVTGFKKQYFKNEQIITHVLYNGGEIKVNTVVNCGGIFAREVGALMGCLAPQINVSHQYMVSDKIPNLPPNLPTFRDPDGSVYYKPEVGGLLMGGWEPNTIPLDLPKTFGPELFSPDYDRFEQHLINATRRTPILSQVGIKQLVNGPIPISPDGEPFIGRTPEVSNAFVAAGITAGIASGGGIGKYLSEWIINGEPSMNLWPIDIRRFGPSHGSKPFLRERSVETLGDYYILKYPFKEHYSARDVRLSPLYNVLKEQGAVYGQKFGFERPNYFTNNENLKKQHLTLGYPNWWKEVEAEHIACRESVVLIDFSSFAKLIVQGKDALDLIQRVIVNNADIPIGGITYTQMCNPSGGIEGDITVTRTDVDSFYIITGSGYGVHDFGWIKSVARKEKLSNVEFIDVTGGMGVINIAGPNSRRVLEKVVEENISNEAFPFMTMKNIYIGTVPVRALRITYLGELGYELHTSAEYLQTLYKTLKEAGKSFQIRDAGYRVVSSLRCEKGYRYWGSDISPDVNPFEAGLGFCVAFDKNSNFIGKDALLKIKDAGVKTKLVYFTIDQCPYPLDGNETIHYNNEIIGLTSSAGYGYTVGKHIAFGYVPTDISTKQGFSIGVYGQQFEAKRFPINKSAYDPDRIKILS